MEGEKFFAFYFALIAPGFEKANDKLEISTAPTFGVSCLLMIAMQSEY